MLNGKTMLITLFFSLLLIQIAKSSSDLDNLTPPPPQTSVPKRSVYDHLYHPPLPSKLKDEDYPHISNYYCNVPEKQTLYNIPFDISGTERKEHCKRSLQDNNLPSFLMFFGWSQHVSDTEFIYDLLKEMVESNKLHFLRYMFSVKNDKDKHILTQAIFSKLIDLVTLQITDGNDRLDMLMFLVKRPIRYVIPEFMFDRIVKCAQDHWYMQAPTYKNYELYNLIGLSARNSHNWGKIKKDDRYFSCTGFPTKDHAYQKLQIQKSSLSDLIMHHCFFLPTPPFYMSQSNFFQANNEIINTLAAKKHKASIRLINLWPDKEKSSVLSPNLNPQQYVSSSSSSSSSYSTTTESTAVVSLLTGSYEHVVPITLKCKSESDHLCDPLKSHKFKKTNDLPVEEREKLCLKALDENNFNNFKLYYGDFESPRLEKASITNFFLKVIEKNNVEFARYIFSLIYDVFWGENIHSIRPSQKNYTAAFKKTLELYRAAIHKNYSEASRYHDMISFLSKRPGSLHIPYGLLIEIYEALNDDAYFKTADRKNVEAYNLINLVRRNNPENKKSIVNDERYLDCTGDSATKRGPNPFSKRKRTRTKAHYHYPDSDDSDSDDSNINDCTAAKQQRTELEQPENGGLLRILAAAVETVSATEAAPFANSMNIDPEPTS